MSNQFEFSKRNRRAILIFLVLTTIIVFIPRFYSFLIKKEVYTIEQEEFSLTELKKNKYKYKREYKKNFKKSKIKYKTPSKAFDPNLYAEYDWMKLGLSEKQAHWIVKYAKNGYYSNEDLKKCFVISDEFFAVIKDSLIYPEKVIKNYNKTNSKNQDKVNFTIEINSADEESLMKIKGIGQFFAKNIIKKRNELGGFVSKKQLLEVWKMDENKLKEIEMFIEINPELIKKISINEITVDELKKHPYFSWNIANSVVKLRQQIGYYQKIEDLKRSILIDEILFEKIKPYIEIK